MPGANSRNRAVIAGQEGYVRYSGPRKTGKVVAGAQARWNRNPVIAATSRRRNVLGDSPYALAAYGYRMSDPRGVRVYQRRSPAGGGASSRIPKANLT